MYWISNESFIPDFLCIGFFCHDLIEKEYLLGGTASYSSLIAKSLGKNAAVLTSVGEDFKFWEWFNTHQIIVKNKEAPSTTVFENIYINETRTQFLHKRASNLGLNDLPKAWKETKIVQFSPIADEVDFALLEVFSNSLKGATIQGWIRAWDKEGKVFPKAMNWEILKKLDVVIMSDADIRGFEAFLPMMIENIDVLVMTKGREGAVVFSQSKKHYFPAFPIAEVDPTGAGDIFATSFLIKYEETGDIKMAAAYANVVASLVVEQRGVQIPTRLSIEERFIEYQKRFMIQDK